MPCEGFWSEPAQDTVPLLNTEDIKAEIQSLDWNSATGPATVSLNYSISQIHINTTLCNKIMEAVLWIVLLSCSKERTHLGDNFK